MKTDESVQIAMMIITHSGTAKSLAVSALADMANKDFVSAKEKIAQAEESLRLGGQEHMKALQLDAEEKLKINVLLIHAEDQFMNAETTMTLVENLIPVFEKL